MEVEGKEWGGKEKGQSYRESWVSSKMMGWIHLCAHPTTKQTKLQTERPVILQDSLKVS